MVAHGIDNLRRRQGIPPNLDIVYRAGIGMFVMVGIVVEKEAETGFARRCKGQGIFVGIGDREFGAEGGRA